MIILLFTLRGSLIVNDTGRVFFKRPQSSGGIKHFATKCNKIHKSNMHNACHYFIRDYRKNSGNKIYNFRIFYIHSIFPYKGSSMGFSKIFSNVTTLSILILWQKYLIQLESSNNNSRPGIHNF